MIYSIQHIIYHLLYTIYFMRYTIYYLLYKCPAPGLGHRAIDKKQKMFCKTRAYNYKLQTTKKGDGPEIYIFHAVLMVQLVYIYIYIYIYTYIYIYGPPPLRGLFYRFGSQVLAVLNKNAIRNVCTGRREVVETICISFASDLTRNMY